MRSYLYQIAHLGNDDDEPEFSSAMPLEEGDTFFFAPRPLKNLNTVDEMESLSPVLHCQVRARMLQAPCLPSKNIVMVCRLPIWPMRTRRSCTHCAVEDLARRCACYVTV